MPNEEERSLDLVQRLIISALVVVVLGMPAVVLASYSAYHVPVSRSDSTILWVMSAALGLVTAAGVLVINRRRVYSPFVLLGLLPALIAAYWIFR